MSSPTLIFNYDISCPFAYIASTRVASLASRTNARLIYRPVLLGAIYRATAAPQGAGGSASDVYNPTKKAVGQQSMKRTLKRYNIAYNPPAQHPRKTVDALRLLYCIPDQEERRVLSEKLFRAYWVGNRDVSDRSVLLEIVKESGISSGKSLTMQSFDDTRARKELETATAEAIERGAFGVPGFWVEDVRWTDGHGKERKGRFWWGQDRMHFVEATLLSLASASATESTVKSWESIWAGVPSVRSLLPRATARNSLFAPTKVQFWFDFSSPWAYVGYTQLARLQRTFPSLVIELKPFLLGILFREIGAPNTPIAASKAKEDWTAQDREDWVAWWNAVNVQGGGQDERIEFQFPDKFPIRTPTVLRVGIVEPKMISLLYSACWAKNMDMADETVLRSVLDQAGYNGADLIARANAPAVKNTLRELTAEAKDLGICGVPTYRVLRQSEQGDWKLAGGLVWGQDELGVVEDLIAGWDAESSKEVAGVGNVEFGSAKGARL
ncbi:thioredoxin-like protein [Plenodomus tracheiphilus IPT5]|uniref:Thioredoxin-like protein n=1 Tax=Plenodomus tracheiphilus IPT5 TaxID=1408161 RepID=A0A6A7B7E0_9PLEO|nr:thioredoxin-like protein [Plenodomus tracheiphilus IPT5]